LCKLLVVEDLKTTSGRYLTDGRRMKAVVIVAVTTLDEYAAVTQAFGKYLPSDVIQVDTCYHKVLMKSYLETATAATNA